jgi:hypothetical protein
MRIIKIKDCSNCPNCEQDFDETKRYDCFSGDSHIGQNDNYPVPLDNCPLKPSEIDNEILINNIEVASELANKAMIFELIRIGKIATEEETLTSDDGGDTMRYTDEAQEVFNRWYDYYREIIDNLNLLK